jgi:hypothetical protein
MLLISQFVLDGLPESQLWLDQMRAVQVALDMLEFEQSGAFQYADTGVAVEA